MNLGKETIKVLQDHRYSKSDILWIGGKDFRIPADNFWEIADRTIYSPHYEPQEVALDLVIAMKDGSWFNRNEYNGAEFWQYNRCPKIPAEIKKIEYLAVDLNNDIHDWGWMTLKKLNRYSIQENQFTPKMIVDSIRIFMI